MEATAKRKKEKPKMTKAKWIRYFKEYWPLYLFLAPVIIHTFVFAYMPMYGAQIAFREYSVKRGIWGSEWVGLAHIRRFLALPDCWKLIRNTLLLNIYDLIWTFPVPIIFALLVNEIKNVKFKKTVQMLSYAPHFISTVALVGLIQIFLRRETGLVNVLLASFGFETHEFLSDPGAFRTIFLVSDVWTTTGWGAIIYIAALAGIDQESIEAAIIDGATRLQRIIYINIPYILPTITILLIMSTSSLLSVGFEKAFLLQNKLNMETSDVISTYTYRVGIQGAQFSYTSAIGLFNSIANAIILLAVNKITKSMSGIGIW